MIQSGSGASIGKGLDGLARGLLMRSRYSTTALLASLLRQKRRIFLKDTMSNKIALSDVPGVCSTV